MSLKTIASGRSDLFHIDPRLILVVPGHNVRSPEKIAKRIKALKPSIKKNGVKKAYKVRLGEDGQVLLVDAECRHGAVMELIGEGHDIKTVPCVPEKPGTTEAQRILDLVIDNDSEPLELIEQGFAFLKLVGLEQSISQIAEDAGKSTTHVKNAIALASAPLDIQKKVQQGKIAASLVIDLIKETKGDQEALRTQIDTAIENAAGAGKDHASRKHLKDKEESSSSTPATGAAPIPQASTPTDWTQVNGNVGSGNGGGPGEPKLSRDADKNLEKFDKMMEKIKPEDCIPGGYALAESIYNFFDGKSDLRAPKNLLLGKTS